jgi:hypothetical protein
MTFRRQGEIGEAFCMDLNEVLKSSFTSDGQGKRPNFPFQLIEGFPDQTVDLV